MSLFCSSRSLLYFARRFYNVWNMAANGQYVILCAQLAPKRHCESSSRCSYLKPSDNLRIRQIECHSYFVSICRRQIFLHPEPPLQLVNLVVCECSSGFPLLLRGLFASEVVRTMFGFAIQMYRGEVEIAWVIIMLTRGTSQLTRLCSYAKYYRLWLIMRKPLQSTGGTGHN